MVALLHPAPLWKPPRSGEVVLWHGCLQRDADAIVASPTGIDPTNGRWDADFGRGFYTTSFQVQAQQWAWRKHINVATPTAADRPVVIRFTVPRDELAALNSLAFVAAGTRSSDYWSLVQHCRQSDAGKGVLNDHRHPDTGRGGWYDMVSGPVAAFWRQCVAINESDQFSFHTPQGCDVLNRLIPKGPPAFEVIPVGP